MHRFVRLSALAFALLLTACDQAVPPPPEPRPVKTVTVDPHPIEDDRKAVGEIKPRYESDLSFRVSGKIIARPFDVGMLVKAGDVLARLEDQDYRNKQRSAEAELRSNEAKLVEAQATEQRQKTLLSSGTTTRAKYDEALRNLRSSEAAVNSSKANLDLANDQIAYTELKADFDGVVTAVGAEAGQFVSSGQMVLRVARMEDRDAVFSISESAFKGGPPKDMPQVEVWLLSDPNVKVEGQVREVSPVADPTTRTYSVKVTLKDPPPQMRFGMSVGGRLKMETAPVVVVPLSAIFDKDGKPAVWVFDPATGTVGLKPVTLLRYEADRAVIGGGLAKGEIVVTAGVNMLREGQKVRLATSSTP